MCGHVGLAGKLEFKDEGTLKRLLLLDYFRGTDSTGVASIRKDGPPMIAKIASHPIDFFDTKRYDKISSAYQSKAFIGHNRAATKGKVNETNAHPYQYGHIVGAHNGTLDTESWKELNEALGYETEVDSMAIFACIEKLGIEETVKMLRGAWALVWADLNENTLNFLRNKERPMWYAYTKNFDRLFWASEWPMIQAATDMAAGGYEIHQKEGGYSFFSMDEDYLYQYDIDRLAKGEYDSLPDARTKKLEGKAPPPVVKNYYQGESPFIHKHSKTTNSLGERSPKDLPSHITMITSADKPFAKFLDKKGFDDMTGGKCMYCLEPIYFEDTGLVVFESLNEVLCGECSGHSVSRYMATPKTYMEHVNPKKEAA